MNHRSLMTLFGALLLMGTVAGCTAASRNAATLGPDGEVHPDDTAGLSDYTGQGRDGEGWAGNVDGEGGPSAIPPARDDLTPR